MARAGNFFAELKRRNVWRAAAVYVASIWALAQGIAQLSPSFNAPDWVTRWFVIAGIIGFPVWVLMAWFYAWTRHGLKLESELAPDESGPTVSHRKMDLAIIAVLAVAVVLLVTNQFVLRGDATSQANVADLKAAQIELAKIPDQSVAVLPLANESGDPKQQYLSDGLSEELISDLAQIGGIKVIGKYSSFQFRDSTASPAQIGAALGVAHLIEGSVRRDGDRVRVLVSLIRARDGANIWSHTYDNQLKDVFAIQSEIGTAVAAALKVRLLGHPKVFDRSPPSGDLGAYQLTLQASAAAAGFTEASYRDAVALLQQAIQQEPGYAFAWGQLANIEVNLGAGFLHGAARQQAFAEARKAADKVMALVPDSAFAHVRFGYVLAIAEGNQTGALAEYRKAIALSPNDTDSLAFLGLQYAILGDLPRAIETYGKAIVNDPLQPNRYVNLAGFLMAAGQLDAAQQAAQRALKLQPGFPDAHLQLATLAVLRGDAATAKSEAASETDPDGRAWATAAAQQVAGDPKAADAALAFYTLKYADTRPLGVARLYAVRKQPTETFDWLERARAADPIDVANGLLYDAVLLRFRADPRFAKLCGELRLPVPGKAPAASNAHA